MSISVDNKALLGQLRTMAKEAGVAASSESTDESTKVDFGELLKKSVEGVNERQMSAEKLAVSFEAGNPNVDLSQVMIEMQKARISFEALSQVRNKVVDAYKDIMNMPL